MRPLPPRPCARRVPRFRDLSLLGRKPLRRGLPRSDLVGRRLFGRRLGTWPRFVQDHAIEQLRTRRSRGVPPAPAWCRHSLSPSACGCPPGEIDVLGVALIVEAGGEQPHHMHARLAAIAGKLLYQRIPLHLIGDIFEKLGNDMAKLVRLALAQDVARNPARILDVLCAIQNLPDGFGLWLPSGSRDAPRRSASCAEADRRRCARSVCWRGCRRPNKARRRCAPREKREAARPTP